MKRIFSWQVTLGVILILLSGGVYFIHYLIFRDVRYILSYLLTDIAFVLLEVFLVTLVLQGLLNYREKKTLLNKLNMVIGAFFSEVGTQLLKSLAVFDADSSKIRDRLIVTNDWTQSEFFLAQKDIKSFQGSIDYKRGDLIGLKNLLVGKREFLVALLENPSLLEHDSFTNMLWAVFHLTEELDKRSSLRSLAVLDYEHLSGDIKRAYKLIIAEWIEYMQHLKNNYPYLFSLAMRTNPFDPDASVELK